MIEQRTSLGHQDLTPLVEQYLGLESMEVTEDLLDLCGARIDTRALPLLKRRLHEEEAQIPLLETRGYVRLVEEIFPCNEMFMSRLLKPQSERLCCTYVVLALRHFLLPNICTANVGPPSRL